jgi:hypothetical protein
VAISAKLRFPWRSNNSYTFRVDICRNEIMQLTSWALHALQAIGLINCCAIWATILWPSGPQAWTNWGPHVAQMTKRTHPSKTFLFIWKWKSNATLEALRCNLFLGTRAGFAFAQEISVLLPKFPVYKGASFLLWARARKQFIVEASTCPIYGQIHNQFTSLENM